MTASRSRIVFIIHPGALGDVLLSLPAIASLRRRYQDHQVVLLARSDIGTLLQTCRVVDQIRSLEFADLASLMAGAGHIEPSLRSLLASCAHVVAWLSDPGHVLERTFTELGVGRISIGTPRPYAGIHQSQRFLEIIGEEQGGERYGTFQLPTQVTESAALSLQRLGVATEHYVICHPGSGSPHKCVRPEVMAAIIRFFESQGVAPVLVCGPADEAAVAKILGCGLPHVPVIQNWSLTAVAGVLARAHVFVGHDSGLTHLAAALRIPTVAIFGPTDPRQWAPPGEHVSVITGGPCLCLTWREVQGCHGKPCLSVSHEAVTCACSSLLKRYRPVTKT